LPDFSWYNIPKNGKKYTNLPQNIPIYDKNSEYLSNVPNGCKIDQHLPLQDPPKIT
jgi:hypothetical protein